MRWIMMFVIGVTVGLVGEFYIFWLTLLDFTMLLIRDCYPHVSFRWACLWISLYISSPKLNLLWLVIVSFI